MRGVPRERRAISMAPSGSMGTPRIPALRVTIRASSSGRVQLQPQGNTEAVPQGGGQLSGPGGGPDEGEFRQVQADGVG